MGSILFTLFSCCFTRKPVVLVHPVHEVPNENTHLIPTNLDPCPPSPTAYQQKIRDRMSTIVRAKQGKMVNVTARLPFNLHNRKLSATMDHSHSHSHSSSSRSISSSATHRYSHFSPYSQDRDKNALHSSTSWSSSVDSCSRDPSASPILNLRLVEGLPSFNVSLHTAGKRERRGRRKERRVGAVVTGSLDLDGDAIVTGGQGRQRIDEPSPSAQSPDQVERDAENGTPRGLDLDNAAHIRGQCVEVSLPLDSHAPPTMSFSPASSSTSSSLSTSPVEHFASLDQRPLTVGWADS